MKKSIVGKKFKNNKTNVTYCVIGEAVNTTNDNDGQILILYKNSIDRLTFAREECEFHDKFTELNF